MILVWLICQEGSGPRRTQSLLRILEMIQLPLCHRAVLFRVRVRNEWTIYTQHDILSREKDSSTLTSKEKDQANVFATSLNPSQTGGKNKTLLWWPAIFLIFYLFIYLNSLGFGIHLFVQQASVESLQHNRCTAVNKTDMASWRFHSAGGNPTVQVQTGTHYLVEKLRHPWGLTEPQRRQ